ncbi:MAG TPA: hypothetical protein VFV01_01755 [Spirillospora sp.]|nr:hypothetical protein [Spirillospora sp.]
MFLTSLTFRLAQAAESAWLQPQDGSGPGVQVPNPPPAPPPGLDAKMNTLLAWGKWGVLICGVAGLFICAGQMAIGRKNRSTFAADGATGIPWVLGGLSLAATAAPIVGVFFK